MAVRAAPAAAAVAVAVAPSLRAGLLGDPMSGKRLRGEEAPSSLPDISVALYGQRFLLWRRLHLWGGREQLLLSSRSAKEGNERVIRGTATSI